MTYSRIASVALPFTLVGLVWLAVLNVLAPSSETTQPTLAPQSAGSSQAYQPSAPEQAKATFNAIYTNAGWGKNAEGVANSGTGSTVATTVLYRTFLQQFLKDHSIRSVVDAGCGDWEFSQAMDWTGIDYRGYDIVNAIVEANKQKYAKPNIQFFVADVVNTDLPPADLLIAKHVLQHLPTADIQKLLRQVSKYKHVLFTDGVNPTTLTADNVDVQLGGYRELDLLHPPFNLPGLKVLTYWDGMHMHQVVHTMPRPAAAGR